MTGRPPTSLVLGGLLKGRVSAGQTDHRHGNRRWINKSYLSRGAISSYFCIVMMKRRTPASSPRRLARLPPPPPFPPLFKRPGERWQRRRAPTITMTSSLQDWRQMKTRTAAAVCTHVSLSASQRVGICPQNVTTRSRWTSGSLPATLGGTFTALAGRRLA